MKTVCLAVPPVDDLYPWKAASAGLKKLGLQVVMGGDGILDADFLVTWSPWNGSRRQALQLNYARAGKPVIVMENGWLSPLTTGVTYARRNNSYYQLALNGWNGTGRFRHDGPARWREWNIKLQPWRQAAGPVLVCGQRGHPHDTRTAPPDWHRDVQIPGIDQMLVIRRPSGSVRPLHTDMIAVSQVHVWSSNAASWAILAGIPVVQYGPNLMVGALASSPGQPLFRGERDLELERLAWGQWLAAELETGQPFARLLEVE